MASTKVYLFNAQTSNGNGTAVAADLLAKAQLVIYGVFDSATFKLQSSPDGGTTWIDVTDSAGNSLSFLTAISGLPVQFTNNELVRGTLSGGGGGLSLTAYLIPMVP